MFKAGLRFLFLKVIDKDKFTDVDLTIREFLYLYRLSQINQWLWTFQARHKKLIHVPGKYPSIKKWEIYF
jgi:hypothetical protein